ncbi:MAG: gamma-glutamyl-gamma-aminobutyrate hydrolase family protein [Ilumatobacteraceae bacterium]
MSPLIAIAGRNGASSRVSRDSVAFAGRRYLNCILRAGGEPVVISPQQITADDAESLIVRFDGLVLMGGADVNPVLYGQQAGPHVYGVLPEQDAFESALFHAALRVDMPILAVCRGMQLANVALGGTLVQHLGDLTNAAELVDHAPTNFPVGAEFVLHEVRLDESSKIAQSMGTCVIQGASFHHQGIGDLASGLDIVGRSSDGLLEAFEHRDHWLIGVQWHPEDTAADDPAQQGLYDAFVERARSLASRA